MKIEISPEKIYEALAEPRVNLSPQEQLYLEMLKSFKTGESWKEGECPHTPQTNSVSLGLRILPIPFGSISGSFERENTVYAGRIDLYFPRISIDIGKSKSIFESIDKRLADTYGESWTKYGNGAGHIISNGEEVIEIGGQ